MEKWASVSAGLLGCFSPVVETAKQRGLGKERSTKQTGETSKLLMASFDQTHQNWFYLKIMVNVQKWLVDKVGGKDYYFNEAEN